MEGLKVIAEVVGYSILGTLFAFGVLLLIESIRNRG